MFTTAEKLYFPYIKSWLFLLFVQMLIDTHTHLYLSEFDPDRESVIQRALQSGVRHFLLPNIDSDSLEPMINMHRQWPECCYLMFGLHPCSVKSDWEKQLENIKNTAEKYSFCGVGEIGLDFYWDLSFKEEQTHALHVQLSWAESLQKPVSLHSRNATDEVIAAVQKHPALCGGVFHCFSGSPEQARKILDIPGFFLGIGGVVTFRNSTLRQVLAEIPPEKIVLETDAPYLAPVPYRGKRNEPSFLIHVVEQLSSLYRIPATQLMEITGENARKIFGI